MWRCEGHDADRRVVPALRVFTSNEWKKIQYEGLIMVKPEIDLQVARSEAVAEMAEPGLLGRFGGKGSLFGIGSGAELGWIAPCGVMSKRLLDICGALVGLIFFSPLMFILFLLVRRDGGPAFYSQERVGAGGRSFSCWKFRSMVVDADARLKHLLDTDAEAREEWARDQKLSKDPRITPFGHFMRITSLDELPQLFNVLRGEMSLIGPRPIVEDEVDRYGDCFFHYSACRPGITGAWQVSGRNDVSYDLRVQLDRNYVEGWTFWRDVEILFKTFGVVILRTGAR